jgi:tetratricopeptide (TPR) repeat protein
LDQEADSLIVKGNSFYHKSDYKLAERYYKEALRVALINLNVLYGEKLHKYEKSEEVNRQLLKMDQSVEAKTNFVESLLRVGKYGEARTIASEVIKSPKSEQPERDSSKLLYESALDYEGYQVINKFFIACSYFLDGDRENGRNQLSSFLDSIERTFKIDREQWIFEGLAKSIDNSNVDDKAKEAILTTIKLLEGKVTKQDAKRDL